MTARAARRPLVAVILAAAALAACGDDREPPGPADDVRSAASAYVRALERAQWGRACRMMTASARADLRDAAGAPCMRALAGGAALPRSELAAAGREVAGAPVRIRRRTATIGPLGDLPRPLRLERMGDRWLIAG